MNELDMSLSGSELFPEAQVAQPYSSYQDVNTAPFVEGASPGVNLNSDDADQGKLSDKEMNFRALREQAAKFKAEGEYWRGQAEAYSTIKQPEAEPIQKELDWEDSNDVKRAWESLQRDNQNLRNEIKDTLAAVQTKAQHQDWNNMVTQHVPELTSKNPIFAEMIQKASNPYEAAYLLAELNSRASQPVAPQQPPTNGNAQRALTNSQKPQTLASVGGGGQLSAADYYASMSDEDFHKIAARNLANI